MSISEALPGAGPASRPRTLRIRRFDAVERWVHWCTASLMLVLVTTAVPLYVGSVAALVGRRVLLERVHVAAGLLLPVPFLLALAGRRWGSGLRADVARVNNWTWDDRRWVRTWGRDRRARPHKFNGGQKLNAAFVAGAVVVMLATGVVMKWFTYFPDSWRTGATFVHDVVAYLLVASIIGHLAYALTDREALRGITRGWVSAWWARHHSPRWYAEVAGEPLPSVPDAATPWWEESG